MRVLGVQRLVGTSGRGGSLVARPGGRGRRGARSTFRRVVKLDESTHVCSEPCPILGPVALADLAPWARPCVSSELVTAKRPSMWVSAAPPVRVTLAEELHDLFCVCIGCHWGSGVLPRTACPVKLGHAVCGCRSLVLLVLRRPGLLCVAVWQGQLLELVVVLSQLGSMCLRLKVFVRVLLPSRAARCTAE